MAKFSFPKISLARKCQFLFGAAVLAIIFASLIIPGIRMNDLALQRDLQMAKELATVTLVFLSTDLQTQDWTAAQEKLDREWPRMVRLAESEAAPDPPRLITVEDAQLRSAAGFEGFVTETVNKLQADRKTLFEFKIDEKADGAKEVRLAMAVRASEAAREPGSLRGVIEVRAPVQAELVLLNYAVLAASLCCGALLALLVFYLITQKLLLSPVRKLRRLAERVAAGEMEARSKIATGDEFEDLGNAFNEMLKHLHDSQEELRKINRSLDTRLGELAETNVALFESNRLKSEFIANVSHELRTPLVSIIGFAELLADFSDHPPSDTSRLVRYANNIHTSGRMLLDIINDLLDLAKIEAGKLELHVVDIDVQKACEALVDFVTPLADKKKLNLALELAEDTPAMTSDVGRLRQILYNLLSNAIKFTPESGSVGLLVGPDGAGRIKFAVKDTGPGIPPEEQTIIFDKFRQIDSSVTREYSGTGLGLAITRELCTMLGGTIELESEPGRGSTFTVRLPVQAPVEAKLPLVNLT